MYQFTDAIGKVKFDEEFSDVVDNIKNDCKQLECMSFSDAIIKINEWIDKVFSPCKCSIIDYPEWFKIVVWRIIYNELKTNPQARQTELIEDNINLPKDVFGKKYWNMYSPDMKLQQEEARATRAASIVNGQPMVGNIRSLDKTAEVIVEQICLGYDKENKYSLSNSSVQIPKYISDLRLEFEKLKQ